MNVHIDWNGQERMTIPHPSVPAFRLLCEQYGIRSTWNMKESRLELEKDNLSGKRIYLLCAPEATKEKEILGKVTHFLSETGMDVTVLTTGTPLPKTGDLYLQYSIQPSKNKRTDAVLTIPSKLYEKSFVLSLQKELRDIGVLSRIHRSVDKRSTTPYLFVQMNLSADTPTPSSDELAMCFASGILRHFQQKHPMTLLASLSPELREAFLSIVPEVQREAVRTTEAEEVLTPTLVTPAEEPQIATLDTQTQSPIAPVVEVKQARVETFFDYTLLSPTDETSEWLIMVNMLIKNTGTETLTNPVIVLRTNPPTAVKISGKILPPAAAELLSVEGGNMWRYLDKDYFKKGRESGEYRIGPTEPLSIAPGETETNSFQLTIIKLKEEGVVSVEGFVHFEEQGYQCTSNNRIALSF